MKKRLLITSIVMMLVVAVALSTATYAWFTANTQVTASTITLKAAVSDADALGIGWNSGEAYTFITSNVYEVLKPMAPTALQDGVTTAALSNSAFVFKTATIKQEDSVFVFNTAGSDETPVTYNNGTDNGFYIKNLSYANTVSNITVTARFADSTFTTYKLTTDTTFQNGTEYFTKSGNVYTKATVTDSDPTAAYTTDATFQANKNYYTVSDGHFVKANVTAGESVTASTYYDETVYYVVDSISKVSSGDNDTKNDGNDLIRIAIFSKQGTDSSYTLRGVLGQTQSTPNMIAADANVEFDKNTTYFVRGGTENNYTYQQTAIADAAAFATAKALGTLCTFSNTAAYGTITANNAVKDLSYYTNVKNTITVTTAALAPQAQVDIIAVAWLDGTALDDTRAGDLGQVTLEFNAA